MHLCPATSPCRLETWTGSFAWLVAVVCCLLLGCLLWCGCLLLLSAFSLSREEENLYRLLQGRSSHFFDSSKILVSSCFNTHTHAVRTNISPQLCYCTMKRSFAANSRERERDHLLLFFPHYHWSSILFYSLLLLPTLKLRRTQF